MNLAPKYFVVQSKEELKTENRLSAFVAVGLVNTEIIMSFIKQLTFCFLGHFFRRLYRSIGMKFSLDTAL